MISFTVMYCIRTINSIINWIQLLLGGFVVISWVNLLIAAVNTSNSLLPGILNLLGYQLIVSLIIFSFVNGLNILKHL